MGVSEIPSGTVITEQDIADRHNQVRALLNSLGLSQIAPKTIGSQHAPSMPHLLDIKKVTASNSVTTTTLLFAEDAAYIESDWQLIPDYYMDSGGGGYTLPPCILLAVACVHIFDVDSAPTPAEWDTQLWLNLSWSKDGTEDISQLESVMLCPTSDFETMHQMVTLFKVIDYSGEAGNFTIDHVALRGISQPGGTGGAAHTYTIDNGVMLLLALYRQS